MSVVCALHGAKRSHEIPSIGNAIRSLGSTVISHGQGVTVVAVANSLAALGERLIVLNVTPTSRCVAKKALLLRA